MGAYIFMLLVIFILPLFSVETYSVIKNTISQLGAQGAPSAWVMNITFISLGVGSVIGGWALLKGYWFHRITLLIFVISIISTAFFQHAPIDNNLKYNITEDNIHSLFATITGFSFTVFAISSAFIVEQNIDRILAISIAILATLLSIMMFEFDNYLGVWQRAIFITSFGWLIYFFWNKKIKLI